ncbi:MAG TPA: glycosyltransferase [Bryobacteraceae bacterium]|nr:glycosyltransferase [Bryobacteraceae bacterium]
MRVALVHYWLVNHRGGEQVLEALCRLLPQADIFTLFCDPDTLSPELRRHKITTSFLDPLRRWYTSLLPLMPLALESFDLRGYDLVISSESGPAKGVILPSTTRHVCYCHTPMRYLWDLYTAHRREYVTSPIKRTLMVPLSNYLRLWDYSTAARVDRFLANSENVRNRIWKTYRRESEVIHPPVAVESFYWKPAEDYFLIVSALVPYKRIDLAVQAFARNGRRLIIAGTGSQYRKLKSLATPNIEFVGHVSDETLRDLYARCRALLVPGEEDFGLTPVEALASGKPVLALGRGGVLDSVPVEDPCGGILYSQEEEDGLQTALEAFECIESHIQPRVLQRFAQRFSVSEFHRKISRALDLPGVSAPAACVPLN